MSADNDQLKEGQEGTTGNDRGMEISSKNDTDATLQDGAKTGNSNGGNNPSGQRGSALNSQLDGSEDTGGKGSDAAGAEGAGGDSVTGAKKGGNNHQ